MLMHDIKLSGKVFKSSVLVHFSLDKQYKYIIKKVDAELDAAEFIEALLKWQAKVL